MKNIIRIIMIIVSWPSLLQVSFSLMLQLSNVAKVAYKPIYKGELSHNAI